MRDRVVPLARSLGQSSEVSSRSAKRVGALEFIGILWFGGCKFRSSTMPQGGAVGANAAGL